MKTPYARTLSSAAQRGLTLIELLVTLSLLAALGMAAVAAWRDVGAAMRLSSVTQAYVASLHLARGEAIKRNGRVVLCKSANGEACAPSGGWEQGLIVFHDRNNNAQRDAGEAVIRRVDDMPPGYRIAGNSTVARYVSFTPYGGTRHVSGAFQAGTITLCRQSLEPSDARQVVINSVGRARIQRVKLAECA